MGNSKALSTPTRARAAVDPARLNKLIDAPSASIATRVLHAAEIKAQTRVTSWAGERCDTRAFESRLAPPDQVLVATDRRAQRVLGAVAGAVPPSALMVSRHVPVREPLSASQPTAPLLVQRDGVGQAPAIAHVTVPASVLLHEQGLLTPAQRRERLQFETEYHGARRALEQAERDERRLHQIVNGRYTTNDVLNSEPLADRHAAQCGSRGEPFKPQLLSHDMSRNPGLPREFQKKAANATPRVLTHERVFNETPMRWNQERCQNLRNQGHGGRPLDIINGGVVQYVPPTIPEKLHARQGHPSVIAHPYTSEWLSMDSLRPPVYVCLRRQRESDSSFQPMELDGRLDKRAWRHVPWSDPFLDIEGAERKPREYPLTRVKMMHDDEWLYVGAELAEPKIWGTLRDKNATMYHENDFEVFLDPDGSRHNYYELELNCLNTIWELVLNKPYKDGYSIRNPYNLASTRTAVHMDGVANSPLTKCTKWSVEAAFKLSELVEFDHLRRRAAQPGDVWRVNFSRVQYQLQSVTDTETNLLQYEKVPDTREDNIVWAPTGVVDIHRPEKWGFVLFADSSDEHDGRLELNRALEAFLSEQKAMERILDTVYYDQRAYFAANECYAGSLEELYGSTEAGFPWSSVTDEFLFDIPRIQRSDPDEDDHQSQKKTPLLAYTVSIKSATQQWNMDHDARLWKAVVQKMQV